jgi:hypothetical protein
VVNGETADRVVVPELDWRLPGAADSGFADR